MSRARFRIWRLEYSLNTLLAAIYQRRGIKRRAITLGDISLRNISDWIARKFPRCSLKCSPAAFQGGF